MVQLAKILKAALVGAFSSHCETSRKLVDSSIDTIYISDCVQELGVENVPGPEIEEPYQFGYFYSYCGKGSWRDTGVRSGALLCCRVGGGRGGGAMT